MPKKTFQVQLSLAERARLHALVSNGSATAHTHIHARILLKADEGPDGPAWTDAMIRSALDVGMSTVARVRQAAVQEGLDAAVQRKLPKRVYPRTLDGAGEAHLVALACSTPPEGAGRWSLRLLADQMVELDYVETISHETVRQTLEKNELKPWRVDEWCIPPEANAEFVAHMEDVLEVYTWPDRDDIRIICMDEVSTQLLSDTREAIPAQASHPKRQDHEYERNGTANIFIGFEPLRGQRFTRVTEQRTRVDWAHWVKDLLDVRYPDADLIVLVMDNLNVHSIASLYEAYPPAEAKRLAMKLEIHYTPKHGSWLNMAEIEASVLRRQCLNDRRIPDRTILARELRAWERRRNRHKATVDWRFTVDDARIKLKRLYPSIDD